MRVSLKLNAIEQEHLQELYDAAGVARDELPYTLEFDALCQDFQDRAFKNAEPEQVFGALLKYVRSSTCSSGQAKPETELSKEQLAQLKDVLRRHVRGGKILPYSSEFETAGKEFAAASKKELSPRDFWLAVTQIQGRTRRPPGKRPATKVAEESGDDAEDGE
jgi:hypothetical protein